MIQENNKQEQKIDCPSILSGFSHSYDSGIAMELGLHAAIIFNHIVYWLRINASKKDAEMIDGKYWMYETQKDMAEFLGYMTHEEVKKAIVKLLNAGLLIKDNFNKNPFDKTNWYTVFDQSLITQNKIKKSFTKAPYGAIDGSLGRDPERPTAPSINKEQYNTNKEIHKNTTPTPPKNPEPEKLDDGGGGKEKSLWRKIEYTNLNGQKSVVTETEIYAYFIKNKPDFPSELIVEAINLLQEQQEPIRCVFKYLTAIIERLINKSAFPKKRKKPKIEIDDSDVPYYGKETYKRGIFPDAD